MVCVGNAGRVAHQTACHDGLALDIARRQRMASRQCDNSLPMRVEECASTDEQRTGPAPDECCKGCLDVAITTCVEDNELLPNSKRGHQHGSSFRLGIGSVRVYEHGNRCRAGHELPQQIQSLDTTPKPSAPGAATPAPARDNAAPTTSAKTDATLLQLMRGILYPASNVLFAAQDSLTKWPTAADPSVSPNPLTTTYGGWQAVENAALAILDDSTQSGKRFILVPAIHAGSETKPVPGEKLVGQMARAIAEWVRDYK